MLILNYYMIFWKKVQQHCTNLFSNYLLTNNLKILINAIEFHFYNDVKYLQ